MPVVEEYRKTSGHVLYFVINDLSVPSGACGLTSRAERDPMGATGKYQGA